MNYNDFFNRLLLEAVNNPLGSGSSYDIPNGIGAEGLADDSSDPAELENDLAVNGQPAVSVPEAEKYYYDKIKIDFTPENRKRSIQNVESFLDEITNAQKTYKNKTPAQQRTMIPTIADLTVRGDLYDSFQKMSAKIKSLKELENIELETQRKREEIMDEDGPQELPGDEYSSTPQV